MRLGIDMTMLGRLRSLTIPSTLLDGLVSYWPLDETSGTRVDAVGSNDLTDNNTVGYDTGVNGNAASFVAANSEYLSSAAVLPMDSDFTVSGWINLHAFTGAHNFVSMEGATGNTTLFSFWAFTVSNVYLARFSNGDYVDTTGTPNETPVLNEWTFFVLWSDGAKGYLQINDHTPREAVLGARPTGAAPGFRIGTRAGYTDQFSTSDIDEVAIWNRVLTEDERTELYNSGAGKFYPFT